MAAAGVRLDDILEALETLSSDFTSYVKKSTGAVVSIGEEYFRFVDVFVKVGVLCVGGLVWRPLADAFGFVV